MADVDVLIVGGGPVGLALAGDLGWRGVSCVLVEQTDGAIYQPKMDGINVRTMEFCRRWNIVETIKACPYPSSYPQDMVYLTSLGGYELGRESFLRPSTGDEQRLSAPSPETRVRCPQNMFDPILRDFAASWPSIELRYRTRFLGAAERDDGVVVALEDAAGRRHSVTAQYVVGCDGGTSAVREHLGITMEGRRSLTYTTNVIVRCAELAALHDKRLAYRHLFIGPEGTWATMVAINGCDEWRFSFIGGDDPRKLTAEEIHTLVRRALGFDCRYEIVSIVPWTRRELVATAFGAGRTFIAGDACHVMSPTGGYGMNTGIGDAVDLAWKLEAAVRGWAGDALLASYDAERRPVAWRAVREASGNLLRTLSPGSNPELLEPTFAGAMARYEVGRRFSATMLREWYKNGVDLGYVYEPSPVCWPETDEPPLPAAFSGDRLRALSPEPGGWLADGTPVSSATLREWQRLTVHLADGVAVPTEWPELPAEDVMIYRPTARPGARAPHVWLADGSSTLDWFGRGFALLRLGDASDAAPLVAAAQQRAVPLTVVACDDPAVFVAYRRPLVLVRPDGHVAWRGERWPDAGPLALIDRVRGA